MIFSLIVYLALAYLLYDRVIRVYLLIHFYRKQGVPIKYSISLPFVGSFKPLVEYIKEFKPTNNPFVGFIKHHYFPKDTDVVPQFCGVMFGSELRLSVNRPEAIEELLITKNKYFDKHPSTAKLMGYVMGDSILFQESNLVWAHKRKVISQALYKEKLRGMIEIIKNVTLNDIANKWTPLKKGDKIPVEIVGQMSNLFFQITLSSLFGQEFKSMPMVDHIYQGQKIQVPLGTAIQNTAEQNLSRQLQPHLILFHELQPLYISSFDRSIKFNSDVMRNYIRKLIAERRQKSKGGN